MHLEEHRKIGARGGHMSPQDCTIMVDLVQASIPISANTLIKCIYSISSCDLTFKPLFMPLMLPYLCLVLSKSNTLKSSRLHSLLKPEAMFLTLASVGHKMFWILCLNAVNSVWCP